MKADDLVTGTTDTAGANRVFKRVEQSSLICVYSPMWLY